MFNAVILATENRRRFLMNTINNSEKIKSDAVKAYKFDLKLITGGIALSHTPSCYGIVLKWLIHLKGFTYAQFAKLYNGTTAQNMNHLINRIDETRYFEQEVTKMCKILKVSTNYFYSVCKEVKLLSESENG